MYCCLDERLYPKLLRGATYGSCSNRWVKYWSSSRKCILYCTLLKLDYSVGFEQNVHCSTIEIATLPVTVSNFWMCWQFFPLMLFFFLFYSGNGINRGIVSTSAFSQGSCFFSIFLSWTPAYVYICAHVNVLAYMHVCVYICLCLRPSCYMCMLEFNPCSVSTTVN